jgi:hypothetical protein
VLDHVVVVGDVGQRRRSVLPRCAERPPVPPVGRGEGLGEPAPAPGTAQVEPMQEGGLPASLPEVEIPQ